MVKTIDNFIAGKRVTSSSQTLLNVFNPATGAVTGKVAVSTAEEVDSAVNAAKQAFPAWSAVPVSKRVDVLLQFRELLKQNAEKLATTLSSEHGKTIPDALGEIARGLEVVEFALAAPHLLKGEYSESVAREVDTYSVRQALGVCVGITPFNFPAMVPMWMYPLAIVCGNTFVLKPSERDPSVTVQIAELFAQAGLPEGVLNVVQGDKSAVDHLLKHPDVAAVSFVGSTKIGSYIYSTAAKHGKRVQALCGAKNHLVVMPDADLDKVVNALIGSAYGSAGERCMAISVAVAVGDQVADQLQAKLAERVKQLKVAPYTDSNSEMGPVITRESLDRIKAYIESGIAEGAKLIVDGRQLTVAGHEQGFFIGGCLFDHVQPGMKIYQEEIFGPVLVIVRAQDFDTALNLVSQHEYGNGAAIFTNDGNAARNFAKRAKIGMIGVNVPIPVPVAYYSFGGWKNSLFGDHYVYGMEGVRFYTRMKTITTRWSGATLNRTEFHFKRGAEA